MNLNFVIRYSFNIQETRVLVKKKAVYQIASIMDYSGLAEGQLLSLIKDQKAEMFRLKQEPSQTSEAIMRELTEDLNNMIIAMRSATPSILQTSTLADYGLLLKQQSLRDSMRGIRSFQLGADVNKFITDLNKASAIHVRPERKAYPKLVEEFLKVAKQLLNEGIFQQIEDSSHDTSTFEQLKAYLLSAHGTHMSNFQHLSLAWDLQRKKGERLTDFAGRLECTIREAAVHIKDKYRKEK